MNQDNQKANQKHISMELTADGARVTNLSLQGSRLILTIEAELADSQVRASDVTGEDAIAAAFRPKAAVDDPHKDTDFLGRPNSAGAPSLGMAAPADTGPGPLSMGSENLPPAPAAAFEPPAPQSVAIPPEQITQSMDYSGLGIGLSPAPMPAMEAPPVPMAEPELSVSDTHPLSFDQKFHEPLDVDFNAAPMAPPMEPVRELTETWDASVQESAQPLMLNDSEAAMPALGLDFAPPPAPTASPASASTPSLALEPDATLPLPGLGFATEPATSPTPVPAPPPAPAPSPSESRREIKLEDDPFAPVPGFAAPGNPPPAPAHGAAELRLGGDDALEPAAQWGGPAPTPAPDAAPAPMMESWDHGGLRLGDAPPPFETPGPLAMTEDSSAVGGARHGEPLPAISFGSDPIALEPTPAPAPAPVPLAPAPAPLAQEPAPAFGFAAPPAMAPQQQAAAPATPIGFDNPPLLDPAPAAPAPAPMLPEDAPTQMAMRPPEPAPTPAPAPVKAPEPPLPEEPASSGESARMGADKSKAEGGTTVLIRYTCPKCKTQGMQAVDKVGTVVNCSNCGKAMRLVMKK